HALFIAFAPADNPRIAVAVIVENGEHGSSTAAPVAREVIDAFLAFYPLVDPEPETDINALFNSPPDRAPLSESKLGLPASDVERRG
ncbi:MAG: hypothetical protein KUG71_10665, partial [Porticoccaceae bacterium]|nr:hypothetical protein [Porticoccaceae bacterium]